MPLDPNILLQSTPQPSIGDQYLKSLAIRNQLNTGQLQQQQIQQGQMQMQATQALNDAMRTAVTTGPDGNPIFDKASISNHLAANGQGHLIPTVMEGLQKIDQTASDISEKKANAAKATQELQTAQTDYAGMAGLAVRDAAYSPQSALGIIAHAVATKNMDPQTAQGLTQKIVASPSPDFVKTLVDPLISQSPKAQQALEQRSTIQKNTAQATQAQEQTVATTAKLPGELTEQQQTIQKGLTANAGQALGAIRDVQAYKNYFAAKSPDEQAVLIKAGFADPANVNNVKDLLAANQTASNLAMTPEQRTTATHQKVEEQQGAQRVAAETLTASVGARRERMEEQALLSPQAVEQQADKYAATGEAPQVGMGPSGALQRAQIMNRAATKFPQLKMAVQEAQFKADEGSLKQNQEQADKVNTWLDTAGKNMQQFLQVGQRVVDSGSPWINKPLRSIDQNALGNADIPAYNAARQVVNNEIAKITNGVGNSGALTDSARHEVEKFSPDSMTMRQAVSVAKVLMQDANNRSAAYTNTLNRERGRIGQPGSEGAAAAAPSQTNRQKLNSIFGSPAAPPPQ